MMLRKMEQAGRDSRDSGKDSRIMKRTVKRILKRNGKIKCKRVGCKNKFEPSTIGGPTKAKRYCCRACFWKDWNAQHPRLGVREGMNREGKERETK